MSRSIRICSYLVLPLLYLLVNVKLAQLGESFPITIVTFLPVLLLLFIERINIKKLMIALGVGGGLTAFNYLFGQSLDASKYGVPVYVSNFPLFDEDTPDEVVATLGVVIPKELAAQLRTMSENLEGGLTGVAAAIEEIEHSAKRGIDEHYQRETDARASRTVRARLDEVSARLDCHAIGHELLAPGRPPSRRSVEIPRHTGLDEGPPL